MLGVPGARASNSGLCRPTPWAPNWAPIYLTVSSPPRAPFLPLLNMLMQMPFVRMKNFETAPFAHHQDQRTCVME